MSQLTHTGVSSPVHVPRRTMLLGALLGLAAVTAVVLILAIGNDSSNDAVSVGSQPSLRTDGGPEETGTAAVVGGRAIPARIPDESRIAASIGSAQPQSSSGPDESRTAAAVGGSSSPRTGGPDESRIASAIGGSPFPQRTGGPDESRTAASISDSSPSWNDSRVGGAH